MPRPSGIIGRVSRPDMPVCGLFHVHRALEIQGKFTGAAMHTPRPSWVTFCRAASAPARKVYPQYLPRPPAEVGTAMGHGTKSVRDSGEVWPVLSVIPREEIVGSGGSRLS